MNKKKTERKSLPGPVTLSGREGDSAEPSAQSFLNSRILENDSRREGVALPGNRGDLHEVILRALDEDRGDGDITSQAVIPERQRSTATFIAKEDFVLAGIPVMEGVFRLLHRGITFQGVKKDGDAIEKGMILAKVEGNTRALLAGERTALNFLQRLSGISTLTSAYVKRIRGLQAKVTDTRKTTPGMRFLEKYAVRIGGGVNHRAGLYDGVLIKDNHIRAAGGIQRAVRLARRRVPHLFRIEVEVKSMREVKSALSSGADVIMLDNMTLKIMEKSVAMIRRLKPGVIIEASGNMNLQNIREAAATGVDLISVGALTHSARAVDISMNLRPRLH